jgi:hypothetical protein
VELQQGGILAGVSRRTLDVRMGEADMSRVAWILGVAVLLAGLPVAAQEDDRGPITWLAYSTVKPGKTEDAVKLTIEQNKVMDQLMADGTVMSWGLATPINHDPDDTWNHVQWVTLPSWEAVDAWVGAIMGSMMAMDEATREDHMKRAMEIYVEGSHYDEVVRHAVINVADPGATKYFYVAEFQTKKGQEEGMVNFFKGAVVPVLDALVGEGAMSAYGMYSPELHLDVDWSFRFWYGLPNLGAIDTMQKAFQSAASQPGFGPWAESLFEMEGHHDKVAMVLHNARPPAQDQ